MNSCQRVEVFALDTIVGGEAVAGSCPGNTEGLLSDDYFTLLGMALTQQDVSLRIKSGGMKSLAVWPTELTS